MFCNKVWLGVCLNLILPGAGYLFYKKKKGLIVVSVYLLLYALVLMSLMSIFIPAVVSIFVVLLKWLYPYGICILFYFTIRSSGSSLINDGNAWFVSFLSLLFPGIGHIYLKKWLSGFVFLLFACSSYAIGNVYLRSFIFVLLTSTACFHAHIRAKKTINTNQHLWLIIFCSFVLLTGIIKSVIYPYLIDTKIVKISPFAGKSMEPTIKDCSIIVTNRLAFLNNDPYYNDIVSIYIKKHGNICVKDSKRIKRIVAMGGDVVEIDSDAIYVNGQQIIMLSRDSNMEYANSIKYHYGVSTPYTVPHDHYFVIGDNLNESVDSRIFGSIHKNQIAGKVTKVIFPPTDIYLRRD